MWLCKLKIKHDSRIANRTKKYGVLCYSILLSKFAKGKKPFVSGLHYAVGKEISVKRFIQDLRKERGVKKIESKGNVFAMLEYAKTIPAWHLEPQIFFVKPVLSNTDGYEYWEVAAWDKITITRFINKLRQSDIAVNILKIVESKLSEIHFPRIMPALTKNQKKAIELAILQGYYKYPRKANLKDLAKEMKIGISTFQEHLRKAENKILPLFPQEE